MSENPYAAPPVNETSSIDSHAAEPASLAPSLRFVTIVFVADALTGTVYALFAFLALRNNLLWLQESLSPWQNAYLVSRTVLGFVWPAIMFYSCAAVWNYRMRLEHWLVSSAHWNEFAQGHHTLWRVFAIQSVLGILLYITETTLMFLQNQFQ